MSEPTTGRPWMPGYGVPEDLDGVLPWSSAEERLTSCRNYFVATTRPDGRPHVMPIWGLWLNGLFCFSTAITSVKSRNLLANPRCTVTIEDGHHSVIVEGVARVTELAEVRGFIEGVRQEVRRGEHRADRGRAHLDRAADRRLRVQGGRDVLHERDALGVLGPRGLQELSGVGVLLEPDDLPVPNPPHVREPSL